MARHLVVFAAALLLLCGCPPKPQLPPAPEPAAESDARAPEPEPLPAIDPEAPVDRSSLATPWAWAEEGDWAEYRTPEGTLRIEVLSTDASSVTIQRGKAEQRIILAAEQRAYRDPGRLDPAEYELRAGARAVGSRDLPCLVVSSRGGEETWYSEELPLNDGVVYREKDGKPLLELLDFHASDSQ